MNIIMDPETMDTLERINRSCQRLNEDGEQVYDGRLVPLVEYLGARAIAANIRVQPYQDDVGITAPAITLDVLDGTATLIMGREQILLVSA